jgi:hypothetical protein
MSPMASGWSRLGGVTVPLTSRVAACRALSQRFASLDDEELAALVVGTRLSSGWGAAHQIALDGTRFLAKRIPVTEVERADLKSTRNPYGIPSYLNYPFGSPGLGVGRELQFAVKASRWVESGDCPAFPILIHHRLLEGPRGHLAALDREPERFVGFTKYRWNEPSMNAYLADRATARHELVMVFEHLPHAAVDWIAGRPHDVGWIVDDVRRVIAFLRSHEVVHFDSDLFNVRTDGQRAYLTDFGLVLDRQFELSDDEHDFLDHHRHFDDGNLLLSAAHQLYWTYQAEPPDRRAAIAAALGIDEATAFDDAVTSLLAASDRLDERGLFPIGRELHTLLTSYGDAIGYMHSFAAAARRNWSARVTFDDARLERLLRGSGYLAG